MFFALVSALSSCAYPVALRGLPALFGSAASLRHECHMGVAIVLHCCVRQTGDNSLTITELPVRTWTQPYKEYLEGMLKGTTTTAVAAGRAKKDKDAEAGMETCNERGCLQFAWL